MLSTLHTNDAISAVNRLEDLGVEPFLVSGSLRGVISQRLVRKICPLGKKPYKPTPDEAAMIGVDNVEDVTFYRGEGCPDCYHTGYHGRRAVFEILMIRSKIRRLVSDGAGYEEIFEAAREDGFVTMKENCRRLVLAGEISAEEALRAINTTVD